MTIDVTAASPLTIAVASDLHAFAEEADAGVRPSHLKIGCPETLPGQHPIAGLLDLIQSNALHADLLLCPGDLGDKATPEGIAYAWKAMHRIKQALGAASLATTTGNHDVDSRQKYNRYDPESVLKNLDPPYPFPDEVLNDRYWARKYVVLSTARYRLVVLNSSGYHVGPNDEVMHGRIGVDTLEHLRQDLQATGRPTVNLLLCHHHPQQHSELRLADYDVMKEGQQLLDLLGSGLFGRWLVVHGHKHHPKLTYASGGALSPVVFSAGSLCASLYLELQTACRNQFYLIRLEPTSIEEQGLFGTITAWDWATGKGWAPSGDRSGLPHHSGFGYRGDLYALARRVAVLVDDKAMSWDTITGALPEVNSILPQDLRVLQELLKAEFNLKVLTELGLPQQIGVII